MLMSNFKNIMGTLLTFALIHLALGGEVMRVEHEAAHVSS